MSQNNIEIVDDVDWNSVPDDAVLEMGNYVAFYKHVKAVLNEVEMEITTETITDLLRSTIQVVEEEALDFNRVP